ncbi:PP2C family protein-serine/threonine phosphatase [Candidatus Zixiibacteriota bacterium]
MHTDPDRELVNFQNIARRLKPHSGDISSIEGIEIYGESTFLNGEFGGDHITYIDFERRFNMDTRIKQALEEGNVQVAERLRETRSKVGIMLADAAGHSITDAFLTAMLHQAFLIGASYELMLYGEVTLNLFEKINTRFYHSSSIDKFITMIYGEIDRRGAFRFISAAHPLPVVFSSRFDRIMELDEERMVTFLPVGTLPSVADIDFRKESGPHGFKPGYSTNQIDIMGAGDILLIFTDGFTEGDSGERNYVDERLESMLRQVKDLDARSIYERVRDDYIDLVPEPDDDVTFVVIKKVM